MSSFRQLMMRNKGGGGDTPYDDTKQLSIAGLPTIVDEVVSNFNDSNYVYWREALNTTFEFKIKLKITQYSNVGDIKCFLGWTGSSGVIAIGVFRTANGTVLKMFLSTNAYSWNIAEEKAGTTYLNLNTDYYVKFSFSGTQYKLELSNDDVSYNNEVTVNSTSLIHNGNSFQLCFGKSRYDAGWGFLGEIDFNKTRFTKNNVVYKFEV